jgi:hypothetical protein
MPQYRLCSVDQHGHVVKPPEYVTCETDEEVIAKAKSMVDGLGIQIWNGELSGRLGDEVDQAAW